MKYFLVILNIMILSGCDLEGNNGEEIKMRVNSYTVECVGEMEGTCLLVQEGDKIGTAEWEFFYYHDSIRGFDYEPGYIYDLIVKRKEIANPPQDGSAFEYELIKIVSKEKV